MTGPAIMSRRVLLTLGAAVALGACGGEHRTGPNTTPGTPSGTPPETATPGSTPPGVEVAKIATFVDDFEMHRPHWGAPYGGGTISWVGGRLRDEITQPAHTGGRGYTGISSDRTWDLIDSSCFIRLYPPTAPSHGDQIVFRTIGPRGKMFLLGIEALRGNSLQLLARRTAHGPDVGDVYASYDPTRDAYLRIRNTGPTMFWETAPSHAGPWRIIRREALRPGYNIASVRVDLYAGNWGTNPPGRFAWWDDLNYPP